MNIITDFDFIHRTHFAYIPLWLLCLLCLLYRTHYKLRVSTVLAGKNQHALLSGFSSSRLATQTFMYSVGMFFLFLAFLGPARHTEKKESLIHKGRDLYIILDISRSMLAHDCTPNRLEAAKQKIKTLVQSLSSERIALILFSGSALIQCPLTTDYAAFYLFLDTVTAETISSGTTSLDRALEKVLQSIPATDNGKPKNTLMIAFTDGEDFSTNLASLKQECKEKNAHFFALGMGSVEGAPIPLYDTQGTLIGHQKDRHGSIVISRINHEFLTTMSRELGGDYALYTPTAHNDIQKIIAGIEKFEKQECDTHVTAPSHNFQYHIFLALSLGCFLLEWLL